MSLGRLLLVCPHKRLKVDHAELAMATYLDDLQGYDSLLVDAACQKWRTTPGNKFFPAIGELMTFLVPAAAQSMPVEGDATPDEVDDVFYAAFGIRRKRDLR